MIGVMKRFNTVEAELNRLLDRGHQLPTHVAIIMDGNGRWAKSRFLPRAAGHREGVKSVREMVELAGRLKIKHLTLYTFSKENWKRPKAEVSMLMKLLASSLKDEIEELHEKNVKFTTIGDLSDLPELAREELIAAQEKTVKNKGLNLNLALSYGSRAEILNAVKRIAKKAQKGEIILEDLDEETFESQLYTKDIPDPDLLIRTSGEQRISNFLLWQLAYSEIYITDTYWPDFRKNQFYEAMISYMSRERRFGLVSEQLAK